MVELQHYDTEPSWRPPSFTKTVETHIDRFDDGIKCLQEFSRSLQIRTDRTTQKCAAALSYDLFGLARWLVQALDDAMARDVFRDNATWVRMVLSQLRVLCCKYVGVVMGIVRLREWRLLRKLQDVSDIGPEVVPLGGHCTLTSKPGLLR